MRAAKIVAIVIGALLIIIGLALVVPGSLLLWVSGAHQDSDGYVTTSDRQLTSDAYALTTPDIRLHIGSADWIPGGGSVQIQVTSAGTGPVFVGIGPTADVEAYLSGVAYDEVTQLGWFTSGVRYRTHQGGAPSTPPAQQTFWVAQQEGSGTQTLRWDVQGGDWTAVVMNGDATAPVDVSVSLGLRLGFLFPVGLGMVIGGVVLLALGITLVVLGARRSHESVPPQGPAQQPPVGSPGGPVQQTPYQQPPYQPPPVAPPPTPPTPPQQQPPAAASPPASEGQE
jgi:uncharacterized membrane protein